MTAQTSLTRSEFNAQYLAIVGWKRVKPNPINDLTTRYMMSGECFKWVISRDSEGNKTRADRGIEQAIYGMEYARQTGRIDGTKELAIRSLKGKAAIDYLYRVYLVWHETQTIGEIPHWINVNPV